MMLQQPNDATMRLPDYLEVWVESDVSQGPQINLTFWCHRCKATLQWHLRLSMPLTKLCLGWTRRCWGQCDACGFYPELAQQPTIQVMMAACIAAAIEGQRGAAQRGIQSGHRVGLEIPLMLSGPGIVEDGAE